MYEVKKKLGELIDRLMKDFGFWMMNDGEHQTKNTSLPVHFRRVSLINSSRVTEEKREQHILTETMAPHR